VASSADGTKLAAAVGGKNIDYSSYAGPIFISTNSGATWMQTSAPSEIWSSLAFSADGTKLLAAAYQNSEGNLGQLYLSSDSGNTWAPASTENNYWVSAASSADGSKLIAVAGYRWPIVFTSTDGGANWISNSMAAGNPGGWQAVATTANGNTWMILNELGTFYTSTNLGRSWESNSLPGQFPECTALASSADGSKVAAAEYFGNESQGTGGGICTSQTASNPFMCITSDNSNVMLSWIVPSTNFAVQVSSDLSDWAGVTNQPVLNLTNLQDQVTLPVSGSNAFFRLGTP
jgi:hypothetical protein